MKKLVLFASGAGSNAENIIRFFRQNPVAEVVAVFTNKADSGVVDKTKSYGIPVVVSTKSDIENGTALSEVNKFNPDLIVLAGFLLKFPSDIIAAYPNKVINIHPALLPKYGGKGMYGMNVHKAILENKEAETGISIHYVNEHYDEGAIIFQEKIGVSDCDTPEQIAARVQKLEHEHFPLIIAQLLK
ncbi:phosphoribosylglycinamide formyltransferase [Flavobacterium sp. MAH-1]|uniref:phosphoribosylglycinamide formyltransferase 1 n=1 Tax=Flavobacterium agri TaxID=2743471 RepID=A0A7Y8Y2M1_9FLAO|nr:phosphoribosylglycinamide formyltransferase [Flavobacterium agri]NUY81322.1 phosphoribosylglycinamide formyltransferase [Flavobacterium agri]NYA71346.1 phosphoribosylglycinamide formyltransferase [Flavobacterium agri]